MTDPTLADKLLLEQRLISLKEKWCSGDYPGERIADQYLELFPAILAALRAPSFADGREAGIEAAAQWHDRMRRAAAPGTGNATRHEWYARDIRALLPSPTPQAQAPGAVAARDVLAERRRHVDVEGWTAEHDDAHSDGEMAVAAACYAAHERLKDFWPVAEIFPWGQEWWKPTDPRRDLVKAGALILAEIERIDRAAAIQGGEG